MYCCSIQIGPALTGARPAPVSPPVLEENSVQFNKLSYLGCTWVKAPRNEGEAQRAMATLRAESAIPIPITLHVPSGPDGSVRSATHQDAKQHVFYGKHSIRALLLITFNSCYTIQDVNLRGNWK